MDLASYDELPERIQLGANAVNDVAAKLQRTASDQAQWAVDQPVNRLRRELVAVEKLHHLGAVVHSVIAQRQLGEPSLKQDHLQRRQTLFGRRPARALLVSALR